MGLAGRGRVRRILALSLAAVSISSLVACSGGGGGNAPTTTGATPTPAPNPQPTIDGSRFYFPARGYAAVIPDGWHANPNSLLAGPQQVDTFFSPVTVEGVQTNISVTCEENPSGVSTEQFVQSRLETLGSLAATDLQTLGAVTVSGMQGQMVSYTLTRSQTSIRKTDVMLATPKCGWTLAVATAPSVGNQYQNVFEKFLQSFALVDDPLTKNGS